MRSTLSFIALKPGWFIFWKLDSGVFLMRPSAVSMIRKSCCVNSVTDSIAVILSFAEIGSTCETHTKGFHNKYR